MKHLVQYLTESDEAANRSFVDFIYSKALFVMHNRATYVGKSDKAADGKHIQGYIIATAQKDHVYLHELTVLGDGSDHGKGFGTAIMSSFAKEADRRGVTLRGAVQPLKVPGGKKIPKAKLRAFYKKFGFEKFGSHPDSIIRYPKK
jgi:GNAT superfamily N-acetyltransferase